jgi:Zn-dependent protease with chaperone function
MSNSRNDARIRPRSFTFLFLRRIAWASIALSLFTVLVVAAITAPAVAARFGTGWTVAIFVGTCVLVLARDVWVRYVGGWGFAMLEALQRDGNSTTHGVRRLTTQERQRLTRLAPYIDDTQRSRWRHMHVRMLSPPLTGTAVPLIHVNSTFLTGRAQLVLTQAVWKLSDEHLRALLAHEDGHLAQPRATASTARTLTIPFLLTCLLFVPEAWEGWRTFVLIAGFILWIVATWCLWHIGRWSREYDADAHAVTCCRVPAEDLKATLRDLIRPDGYSMRPIRHAAWKLMGVGAVTLATLLFVSCTIYAAIVTLLWGLLTAFWSNVSVSHPKLSTRLREIDKAAQRFASSAASA